MKPFGQLLIGTVAFSLVFSSCNKMNNLSPTNAAQTQNSSKDAMVATPAGAGGRAYQLGYQFGLG